MYDSQADEHTGQFAINARREAIFCLLEKNDGYGYWEYGSGLLPGSATK